MFLVCAYLYIHSFEFLSRHGNVLARSSDKSAKIAPAIADSNQNRDS